MWIWSGAIFLAVIILIIILVLLSNIHIEASMETHNTQAEMELRMKLIYGIIRFHYDLPVERFEEMKTQIAEMLKEKINEKRLAKQGPTPEEKQDHDEASEHEGDQDNNQENNPEDDSDTTDKRGKKGFAYQLQELMKSAYAMRIWNTADFSKIRIIKFTWHTKLGTEDVVFTSIATGLLWGIKNMMLGWLSYKVKFTDGPQIQVNALWDERWAFDTTLEFRAYIRFFRAMKILHMVTRRLTDAHGGFLAWRRDLNESKD